MEIKIIHWQKDIIHFFPFCYFFFVLQKQTILFVQYLKDIQSDKAAQTTVKPKSTTVFCDQWFVQNRLQTCCKAVTLQLVLSFTDLTFPQHFDYAKRRRQSQLHPSLFFTMLCNFDFAGKIAHCFPEIKTLGISPEGRIKKLDFFSEEIWTVE